MVHDVKNINKASQIILQLLVTNSPAFVQYFNQ